MLKDVYNTKVLFLHTLLNWCCLVIGVPSPSSMVYYFDPVFSDVNERKGSLDTQE